MMVPTLLQLIKFEAEQWVQAGASGLGCLLRE